MFDRVHPVVVAAVDEVCDGVPVVVPAVGTHGPSGLVLVALHVNGVLAVGLHLFLASHRAGVAGGVAHKDVLFDILAGDRLCGGEADLLGVLYTEATNGVYEVH